MKNIAPRTTGIARSSIKSVVKSANIPDGKVGGLKSNNGIENSVSGVPEEDQEQNTVSGAILGVLFQNEKDTAETRAQSDTASYVQSLQRFFKSLDQQAMGDLQKQPGQQALAGIATGAISGAGALLAGRMQRNADERSQEKEGLENGQNQNVHNLTETKDKDAKKFSDNPHQGMQENFGNQQQEMIAQNETQEWDDHGIDTMDATDPEGMFT